MVCPKNGRSQKDIAGQRIMWYIVDMEQSCCKVESLPNLKKKGGGAMSTYEILSLLFFGGNFLIALLAYIDRNNKRK